MTLFQELPELLPPPIDLDRAAGVVVSEEIRQLYPAIAERYSRNPHGLTCYAEECRRALRLAERRILSLVGANDTEAEIVWCANATEALNLALKCFPFSTPAQHIAIDAGGHPALTQTAKALKRHVSYFDIDDQGGIQGKFLDNTVLVGLSLVNNETGVIWKGDRTALPPHSFLLVDACQAFGKYPIPWKTAQIDMLVVSGRKLGGPATGACLIVRRGLPLRTLLHGGAQQQNRISGTIDTTAVLLFAMAAETAVENAPRSLAKITELNQYLRQGLNALGKGTWPIFSPENALPYILYFAIPNYEAAVIARLLAAEYHILVGTGSACSAESNETSTLLKRRSIPDNLSRAAIRISLAQDTTKDDIDAFLNALPKVLKNW